ncbi:MAG TPA: formate dehydrogenase subunit gamma [Methylibium sp.]
MTTVRAIVQELSHLEGALLPILHRVQEALGFVPREALPVIAQALNLSRAEVQGVLGYYSHFRQQPAGRCVVQVCAAESCQAMGGEALLMHARATLGCSVAQPASGDGAYTVTPVYCLGLCALSPAVTIDGQAHARMTPARLDTLLAAKELLP